MSLFMVSFDVVSLFTNIPLEETINIIVENAFGKKPKKGADKKFHGFSRSQFIKLLRKCTKESHFQFLGKFFDQTDGVAMGSPLAPTFANFFMDWFERTYMPEFEKLGLVSWWRYVDDTFVLIKDLKVVDELLKLMNTKHKNIKFTIELERKKKIPFLDVLISRKSMGYMTTIYRKPTFTGVYLNWMSLTAKSYKIGLIKCLLNRAWKICSNYELFHLEVLKTKAILRKNEYPCSVIDKEIKKFMNRKYPDASAKVGPAEDSNLNKNKIYLVLPYFNNKMDDFSKRLTDLVFKYYPSLDFRLMFSCPASLSNRFSFKDKTPVLLQSLVVYRIGCQDCKDFYIGKTARCLIRRIAEHKNGIGKGDYQSALYKHALENKHTIDYEGIEILDKANSDHKLLLKEMLYINKLKPTLNRQKNSSLFSLIIGKNSEG